MSLVTFLHRYIFRGLRVLLIVGVITQLLLVVWSLYTSHTSSAAKTKSAPATQSVINALKETE